MKSIAFYFTILNIIFIVSSYNPVVVGESKISLRKIYEIDNLCSKGVCRGFEFNDVNKVAFFDLKAEVLINKQSTYDIINPLPYKHLVFKNSTFAHFPLHLFYSIDVYELDMRNCSMEIVAWDCFLAAENLKLLFLSDNKIEEIMEFTFNFLTSLQFLFLDNNQIATLDTNSFRGLTDLKNLNLANNRIKSLPDGIFDYLTSLIEIDISNNYLYEIGNEIFTHNPNLIVIHLKNNELKNISEHSFKNQDNMNLLDISNNEQLKQLVINIRTNYLVAANCSLERVNIYGATVHVDMHDNKLSELYFAKPETLETLNLCNNALEQLASLTRATNLRILNLADNPNIKNLPVMLALNSLESFDLSNNSLTSIPILTMATQQKLRRLNVSKNKIRELNPINFKYFEKLDYFYIHENDWNCYNLEMIMDFLIKPNHISYNRDTINNEFPGEYLNGIACMYRLENENLENENVINNDRNTLLLQQQRLNDEAETTTTLTETETETETVTKIPTTTTTTNEIEELRNEMKVIMNFYEQKFDKAFKLIDNLEARLRVFETMKSSLFEHITITT